MIGNGVNDAPELTPAPRGSAAVGGGADTLTAVADLVAIRGRVETPPSVRSEHAMRIAGRSQVLTFAYDAPAVSVTTEALYTAAQLAL